MGKNKKQGLIIFLLAAVYFASYITRKSYSSVIVALEALDYSKTYLASALTVNAVVYGCGQVVSGFLSDRFHPERLIFLGLAGGMLINFLMPFVIGLPIAVLMIAWGINGFAQAMIWPPLVKIMVGLFDESTYRSACVYVCWGGSIGTIFAYVSSSFLIAFSWKAVFWFAALVGAAVCAIWFILSKDLGYKSVSRVSENSKQNDKITGFAVFFIAFFMLIITLQGILRDGVEDWMPTMLSNLTELDAGSAILSSAILPVFSMAINWLASRIAKLLREELLCAASFFTLGVLAFVGLITVKNCTPVTVVCAALASASAHGVNYCMTCLVPPKFGSGRHAGFISGILNGATYIGSAIAASGTAFLMEGTGMRFGWNQMLLVWGGIALLGMILCALLIMPWKKFKG